ncbi:MAG TPA: hypothetical protein VFR22_15630 [Nocardioidaceae bacterium]|nr:hypothetical protein [Nocardioidaceae bacterium]
MTKIHHDFASNEEGLAFTNGQVTGAQDARDAAVSANNVARAGLGDDLAGADALAQRSQIEFQRDTEFADLAQVQHNQGQTSNDIQHATAGRVQSLFNNA